MCTILIEKPNQNIDFIMYNHLYSQVNYKFTIKQLFEELSKYGIDITEDLVKNKVESWINMGIVKQNIDYFSVCQR